MAHSDRCYPCFRLDEKTDCRGCVLKEYFTSEHDINALKLLDSYMTKGLVIRKLNDLRAYGGSYNVYMREMGILVPRLMNNSREIDRLDVEIANLKSQIAVLMDALKLNKHPIEGESSVGNSQYVVHDVGLDVAQNVEQGAGLNAAQNAGQGVGLNVALNAGEGVGLNAAQNVGLNVDESDEYDNVSRVSDTMIVSSSSSGEDEWVSNSLKVKGGDGSGNDNGDDVNASPK